MVRTSNVARKKWILIGIGLSSFLTMLVYLVGILTHKENFSFVDLGQNVLRSFPFMVAIAYVDYLLVKYINNTRWLYSNLVIRILFEFTALSALAILFLFIGSIPFKYSGNLAEYINSMFHGEAAMPVIIVNIFTITVIEFFVQNQRSIQREIEFERLQTDNLKMQYQQLKGQINPHFLFNSLNVLVSLINKDPERATLYTKKLSEVYRYVLTHDMQDTIRINEELEFIRNYVDILHIRFGKGLQIRIEVSEQDLVREISPMALQVLVENAVKHNVVSASKPLHVHILTDGEYLTVVNNISLRSRVEKSTGIGLKNLSEKYKIIMKEDIIVENNHLQFTVKIPLL